MRLELRQLLDELHAWGNYRHDDVADTFRQRANRVLLHLRSQPDGRQLRLPPDFEFQPDEYTPGAFTITEAGAARLESFVVELAALIPGGGVAPRTALSLAPLHPKVQGACAAAWQAETYLAAVQAARDLVLNQLARLAGLPSPHPGDSGSELTLVAQTLDVGRVLVGEFGSPEQEAVRALARGLVHSVRAVPAALDSTPERFSADRAYELLSLASLVLHQLEFSTLGSPEIVVPEPSPASGSVRLLRAT
jgi:hypothetical protein